MLNGDEMIIGTAIQGIYESRFEIKSEYGVDKRPNGSTIDGLEFYILYSSLLSTKLLYQ